MSRFNDIFDQWAPNYDQTVYDRGHEYSEVFSGYEEILEEVSGLVSRKGKGTIMEVGMGTGNLSKKLVKAGHFVIGIEPSSEMRKKAAAKLDQVLILDGHFLAVPWDKPVDGIVTSYAFHHLTEPEKTAALKYLDRFLVAGGRFVLADTIFESPGYRREILKKVENAGALSLYQDLLTEYYSYLPDILKIFSALGYHCQAKKMNKYVWIICADKPLERRDEG